MRQFVHAAAVHFCGNAESLVKGVTPRSNLHHFTLNAPVQAGQHTHAWRCQTN